MGIIAKARKRLTAVAALVAAAAMALSGCSSVSTQADMVALHYDGGWWTSPSFIECVPVATYKMSGMGHSYYAYPASVRTYSATNDSGSETGPIVVVSKDNAELAVSATVTFTLLTDCETLQKFHESIANRDGAYWGGSDFVDANNDGTPDGWVKILNFYIGKALEATLDRASQGYEWRKLWNDPAVKTELEKAVEENLAGIVDDQMRGHFFDITTILLQTPDPVSEELKAAVVSEQTAVAKAKSAEAEAKAQETTAAAKLKAAEAERDVEVAKAKTEAAVIAEQIRVMGEEAWIKKYGIDHGITPWPNPVVPGANTSK